jgi:hypothetical protein
VGRVAEGEGEDGQGDGVEEGCCSLGQAYTWTISHRRTVHPEVSDHVLRPADEGCQGP